MRHLDAACEHGRPRFSVLTYSETIPPKEGVRYFVEVAKAAYQTLSMEIIPP